MKTIIIILYLLCTIQAIRKSNLEFDQQFKNWINNPTKQQVEQLIDNQDSENIQHNVRKLQVVGRQNMRVTLDTTDLSTVKAGTNGASNTTITNLNHIKRAMQVVQQFLQTRLKVVPVAKIFAPILCVDHTPPSNDVSNGIASSDLHIYVLYITDSVQSYRATAKSCQYISSSLPDSKMQHGRPIVGRIIFNTQKIIDNLGQTTNRIFSDITAAALHEVIHILGFDSSLYSEYLDSSTTNKYSTSITETATSFHTSRPPTILIKTPLVTAWARNFFDCASIAGMQLENQDGSLSSHWQRSVMYDQLMTSTQLGAQKGISGLTFALLKDMGWYDVDDTFNDTNNYGYHKGCSFYNDICYSSTTFQYFCDATTLVNVSRCSSNYLSKSLCQNGAGWKADGCGIYAGYFHCTDPDSSDDGLKAKSLGQYGTNSFCVISTMGNAALEDYYQSRCYPYTCTASSKTIVFTVGSYTVSCFDGDAGTNKTVSALSGTLTCPEYTAFCEQSRKICKNWCSSNGFCTRGVCNCLSGFSGEDCSITICTAANQYYNPAGNNCLTICPSKTYQNKFCKTCLPCDAICDQCRDQSHICTSCVSTVGNPQYFYNGNCLSSCPAKTFISSDKCQDCDTATSNCYNCSQSSTNCTSCSANLFLSTPTSGTCGSNCASPYVNKDIVNFKCVENCQNNLILESNQCKLCPNGSYKKIGTISCENNCPDQTYPDQDLRLCAECDTSCEKCDGKYAENCTKCSSSATERYLHLKMCVSTCPRGTYQNDAAGQCKVCSPTLHCTTCDIDSASSTVFCTACEYGYYYQTNKTCLTECQTHKYKNKWNHSCQTCHTNCQNCSSPSQSSCLTCPTTKYLLTNISGGFCLDACPTSLYVTSSSNCQPCYQTCNQCNGVTSSHCFSCIDGLYFYSGFCRYVCPAGTYPDDSTKSCQACNSNCTFCFAPTIDNCTACISSLVLNNFTCTTQCPQNLNANNDFSVCVKWQHYVYVELVFLMIILFMI